MSETLDTIKCRRSCRSFKPDPVPDELLDQVLEAGMWAPSGMGKQSPVILVIANKEIRDKLSRVNAQIMGTDKDPFYGAPLVLVVLADTSIPTYHSDGDLVIENMLLAATDLGLASCYIYRAKEEFETKEGKALLKRLGIEGNYEGIGHVILGYADAPTPKPAARKDNYVIYVK